MRWRPSLGYVAHLQPALKVVPRLMVLLAQRRYMDIEAGRHYVEIQMTRNTSFHSSSLLSKPARSVLFFRCFRVVDHDATRFQHATAVLPFRDRADVGQWVAFNGDDVGVETWRHGADALLHA